MERLRKGGALADYSWTTLRAPDDRQITLDDRQITLDDRRITLDDRQITLDDSQITLNDPQITLDDLQITLDDLQITLDDLQIALDDLQITLDDLQISLGVGSQPPEYRAGGRRPFCFSQRHFALRRDAVLASLRAASTRENTDL